jgi:hypothetical protein
MPVLQGGVPRPASPNDSSIALRLPEGWLKRAENLIEFLSTPGIAVTRSDVLRAALARGLEALEADRDGRKGRPKR